MNLPITLTHAARRDLVVLIKMLIPLLFILLIAAHFHEFIVDAIKENVAINLGIIVAALYGVVLILLRLKSAMDDFGIIERFGQEARNGRDMKVLLEQPWLKSRYVRHYLQHIANTGGNLTSQMDQNAIENELHALQDEYSNKLELPQFLVGFMIAMGLLGTFIGLLETLTGISGMLDGLSASGSDVQAQFMKLVVELRKPLAGMGIAFSASMFGLVTSLLLAVMMTNLRRYIGRVISLARNVMHELTVMTANVTPAVPVAGKVVEVQSADKVSSVSSTMLVGRFDILSRKIETVLEAFDNNIKSTQKLIDLLSFGPRMKETSEKTLEELKIISNRLEASNNWQNLLDNVKKIEDVNLGGARHLWDIKEKLTKLSDNLSIMDLIASNVGGQTALLETLVDEMRVSNKEAPAKENGSEAETAFVKTTT